MNPRGENRLQLDELSNAKPSGNIPELLRVTSSSMFSPQSRTFCIELEAASEVPSQFCDTADSALGQLPTHLPSDPVQSFPTTMSLWS